MGDFRIPSEVMNPSPRVKRLASLIKKEAGLNSELNELAREQACGAAEVF